MPIKILITDTVHDSGLNYLRDKGYELAFSSAKNDSTLIRDLSGCSGVIVRGTEFSEQIMRAAPDLKIIGKHGVGTDNIDLAAAKKLGIRVVNTPLANTVSVAEQTMLLILSCAKRFRIMQNASITADYNIRRTVFTDELHGKTLGLIGFGRIGSALANIAVNGFSMKVYIYDPYLHDDQMPEWVVRTDNRQDIFIESDYVSLHLPDTEKTRKSVGEQEFRLMKPTSFIINAARGAIIDENALITALEGKVIAGAGLDVMDEEPPQPNNPLLQMENVVLTPHNAASTAEAMQRMCLHVAQGIDDYLSGNIPKWVLV